MVGGTTFGGGGDNRDGDDDEWPLPVMMMVGDDDGWRRPLMVEFFLYSYENSPSFAHNTKCG